MRLEFGSLFCGADVEIFTEVKHTFYFATTPFGNMEEMNKFCIITRFRAFSDIIHDTHCCPLHLVTESIVIAFRHHALDVVDKLPGLLPNIQCFNSSLHHSEKPVKF